MDTEKILSEIDKCVAMYNETGNRQTLTKIRQLCTKIKRQSPALAIIRLPMIAQKNGISMPDELNW